jgi:predicted RNase H-like nuclease (RuvC/YqgF family)
MADPTEIGGRAFTAAQNFIRRGQEVAKREGRIIRLQTQVSKLRSQRQRLFQDMGEKVFALFQRDLVKNQELRMMCQQIRSVDAEIEMRREEVDQLRRSENRGEDGVDAEPHGESAIVHDDDEIIRG